MNRTREEVLNAEIASPGLARGTIHRLDPDRHPRRGKAGTPAAERRTLAKALAEAKQDLSVLAATAEQTTADHLARQIGALSDAALLGPAFEAIDGGEPAVTAFRDAAALRIADGKAGGADLADLRDRVLRRLTGDDGAAPNALPENAIVIAEQLTLSRFLEIDWRRACAAVTLTGNPGSHLALLARSRGVPLLIAPDADLAGLGTGLEAIVDAEAGRLILSPAVRTRRDYECRIAERRRERVEVERWLGQPAETADGTPIRVYLNVDDPARLAGADPAHCDGIGLARSEFLFPGENGLPDEERQYRVYRALLTWAGGLPVTIRTLDAGGDKPIPGVEPEDESGPFLGLRGLRLSLARPEGFRVQLRALARAAAHGPLKVMVPMVTSPQEFERARGLITEEATALEQAGGSAACPEFGMMVETPAAAREVARFDADFYAIGTNDLLRFLAAGGRDGAAEPKDPLNPEVLELVARVCAWGRTQGREVSLCGEAASRPECIPALLGAGLRALSVPSRALAEVKKSISRVKLGV